jgi:hypothetical protein
MILFTSVKGKLKISFGHEYFQMQLYIKCINVSVYSSKFNFLKCLLCIMLCGEITKLKLKNTVKSPRIRKTLDVPL